MGGGGPCWLAGSERKIRKEEDGVVCQANNAGGAPSSVLGSEFRLARKRGKRRKKAASRTNKIGWERDIDPKQKLQRIIKDRDTKTPGCKAMCRVCESPRCQAIQFPTWALCYMLGLQKPSAPIH